MPITINWLIIWILWYDALFVFGGSICLPFVPLVNAFLFFHFSSYSSVQLVQLLLKASQDKKFVCEAAERALISMTTWVSPSLLLPKLQPYLKNRNPRIRAKASMCFGRSVPRLVNQLAPFFICFDKISTLDFWAVCWSFFGVPKIYSTFVSFEYVLLLLHLIHHWRYLKNENGHYFGSLNSHGFLLVHFFQYG